MKTTKNDRTEEIAKRAIELECVTSYGRSCHRMITAKMAEGMSFPEAFDAVFGSGRYEAIASEIYGELRGE